MTISHARVHACSASSASSCAAAASSPRFTISWITSTTCALHWHLSCSITVACAPGYVYVHMLVEMRIWSTHLPSRNSRHCMASGLCESRISLASCFGIGCKQTCLLYSILPKATHVLPRQSCIKPESHRNLLTCILSMRFIIIQIGGTTIKERRTTVGVAMRASARIPSPARFGRPV